MVKPPARRADTQVKTVVTAPIYIERAPLVVPAALFEVEDALLVLVALAVPCVLVTAELVTKPLVSLSANGWFQRMYASPMKPGSPAFKNARYFPVGSP